MQLLQLFESVPRIRTLLGVAEHSTSLDLSARHGTLGPAGVRLLAAELGARRAAAELCALDLSGSPVTGTHVEFFPNGKLKRLEHPDREVRGVESLVLAGGGRLRSLAVAGCFIGDAGVSAIAEAILSWPPTPKEDKADNEGKPAAVEVPPLPF